MATNLKGLLPLAGILLASRQLQFLPGAGWGKEILTVLGAGLGSFAIGVPAVTILALADDNTKTVAIGASAVLGGAAAYYFAGSPSPLMAGAVFGAATVAGTMLSV